MNEAENKLLKSLEPHFEDIEGLEEAWNTFKERVSIVAFTLGAMTIMGAGHLTFSSETLDELNDRLSRTGYDRGMVHLKEADYVLHIIQPILADEKEA